jgi:hypothetical protein
MLKAAILTLSDRSFRHERADLSGPALASWLRDRSVDVRQTEILPDEAGLIADRLRQWADSGEFDLIVTTGGTGVSPRDVTPENRFFDEKSPVASFGVRYPVQRPSTQTPWAAGSSASARPPVVSRYLKICLTQVFSASRMLEDRLNDDKNRSNILATQ